MLSAAWGVVCMHQWSMQAATQVLLHNVLQRLSFKLWALTSVLTHDHDTVADQT